MDTIHCRLSDEHTAIWACACDQPPLNFCSSCLLTHLTSPGSHTPTPLGPAGPYTCGMCKGQVRDAVSVKYPVCLCHDCMDRYKVTGVPEAHFALHGDIQEAALKVQGEGAQEAARKIQAAVPQANFKSLVYEKRVELMMHLTNALEDMNSIEEVKQRALTAERQLEERRQDVERLREEKEKLLQLQQGGVSQVHVESSLLAKLEEMFEKMEHKQTKLRELEDLCAKLASEKELLLYQNTSLSETVTKLQEDFKQARVELSSQQELKKQVEALSTEVARLNSQNFSAQVKESITSLTEYLTKAMAERMTDVLPLVAHLKVDESWLDEDSAESFLDLARLGVQDLIDIKSIRQISRVCAQVAKAVEPCKSVASFVTTVNKLLRDSSEKGKGLVRRLELIYHKMSGHQSARDVLRGFLELPTQGTSVLDEAIHLVADLSQVLEAEELGGFSIAMTHYLGQTGDRGKKLLSRLSSLPIQWPEHLKERGVTSMKTLLGAVVRNQFNKPCLKLSKVLSSYGQHDPELLLTFTLRACDALLTKTLETDLHSLFKKMDAYIQFASNLPEQESHQQIEKSFLTINLLLPGAKTTKDQLELLASVLTAMQNGTKASKVLDSLLEALLKINAWEPSLLLGFAVLDWMFDRRGGERVEFAGKLLKWVSASDPRVLNESVQQSVSLLKALKTLAQALKTKEMEGLEGLMNSGVEFPKVHALIVTLAAVLSKGLVAAKMSEFISNLLSILDPGSPDVRGEITDRYTAAMQKGILFDGVLATSQCHTQMKRRGSAPVDALLFVTDVLGRLASGGDNTELYSVLKEMTSVLSQERKPYAVAFKSCEVYVRSRSRLPMDPRPLTFYASVLRQLQSGNDPVSIENFLKEFLSILVQDKNLYSVAFELGQLYTKLISNPVAASKFLREELVVLRNLPVEGELETLLQDIQTLTVLTSEEAIAFTKTIFQLCTDKPAEILPLTRTLKTLVRQAGAVQLVKDMMALAHFDVRDLLDVVRIQPTAETITAAKLLVLTIKRLTELGTPVPQLNQPLKDLLTQRAADLARLLTSITPMLRKYDRSDSFALQLLDELPNQDQELMCFAPELLLELAATALGPQVVIPFCQDVIMKCFTQRNPALLAKIKNEPRDRLIDLLRRKQGQVTLQMVEALYVVPVVVAPVLPLQIAEPTLPNVQANAMRFFDFQRNSWGNPMAINPAIKADNSSYTFLGGDEVFCCGGG